MHGGTIGNFFAGLVVVAAITTVVAHPASANIIKSVGGAGADLFRSAQGLSA